MKTILFLILGLFVQVQIHAQNKAKYPLVGNTFEDYTFYEMVNYPAKTAKISDFRDKWLILDMWGPSCTGCLKSFPKMDSLSKIFAKDVQIIMVGITQGSKDEEKRAKDRYNYLRDFYKLSFTVAFDSVLSEKTDVGSLPLLYIIDPKGILRAKVVRVDSAQLALLISGGHPEFERAYSASEKKLSDGYNWNLPYLTNGTETNGGNDTSFLYRSVLSLATEKTPFQTLDLFWNPNPNKPTSIVAKGRLEALNMNLTSLYSLAYFGTNVPEFMYQKNRSSLLKFELSDTTKLSAINRQLYSYSVSVPKLQSSVPRLMKNMQVDLYKYFGWKARVEKRPMPVWALEVVDPKKFHKFITQRSKDESNLFRLILQDKTLDTFAEMLTRLLHTDIPVINQTQVTGPVYLVFKSNSIDTNDVKAQLNNNGLVLTRKNTDMETIVISDDKGTF